MCICAMMAGATRVRVLQDKSRVLTVAIGGKTSGERSGKEVMGSYEPEQLGDQQAWKMQKRSGWTGRSSIGAMRMSILLAIRFNTVSEFSKASAATRRNLAPRSLG